MTLIPRLIQSVRKRVKPTAQDLAKKRWHKENGNRQLRYDCPLNADSVVFDMGGYEGSWAAEIFARFACRVEVFEPVPSFASAIRERFAHNSSIQVHACGLGAKTRTESISMDRDASSIFAKSAKGSEVPIKLIDAGEWFEEHPCPRIDFMKMNIEGGEYELLERLIETGLITRIVHLHVQFHDLLPGSAARMESIRDRLAATHDTLFQYQFVWDGWRLKGA